MYWLNISWLAEPRQVGGDSTSVTNRRYHRKVLVCVCMQHRLCSWQEVKKKKEKEGLQVVPASYPDAPTEWGGLIGAVAFIVLVLSPA